MVSLLLLIVAFILACIAGTNNSLFDQGPADLVAWSLACYFLSVLLSGVGPAFTYGRRAE